jgi:hypothetical protein
LARLVWPIPKSTKLFGRSVLTIDKMYKPTAPTAPTVLTSENYIHSY